MAFLRRIWNRYPKLGKKRKKKQIWRRPKGRDNKMREKRKGYPVIVSVGYKKGEGERKQIKTVRNLEDLKNVKKNQIIMLGNIGKKKKIEIVKKAEEMKIPIQNVNIKNFLKKVQKTKKETKEEQKDEKKTKDKTKKEKIGGKKSVKEEKKNESK